MNTTQKPKIVLVAGITPSRLAQLHASADPKDRKRAKNIDSALEARTNPSFNHLYSRFAFECATALGRKAVGLTPAEKQAVIEHALDAKDEEFKDREAMARATDLHVALHRLGWSRSSDLADPEEPTGPTAA